MNLFGLAKKSTFFFWRTNIGVLLTVMVGTAVLVGALVVGDSVRYSLGKITTNRLGRTKFALVSQGRFFRAALADDLQAKLNTETAPVLQLRGVITNEEEDKRANQIDILGVDGRFFSIGGVNNFFTDSGEEGIILNEPLATQLFANVGDEVVLRIEKPGLMPRDIPLSPDSDLSIAFRLPVKTVASEEDFGRFNLQANQIAPLNVFVPIEWLQEKIGRDSMANMLLVASNPDNDITIQKANQAVAECWQPADAELEVRRLDERNITEIRSNRVFIDPVLTDSAVNISHKAIGVLTYFVNELKAGDKTTPYSMVTAMSMSTDANSIIPPDMQNDEILINQWLANDLEAKVGDSIELTYYVLSSMRRLQEKTSTFRIRQILPMEYPFVDPELMPDFPGLSDAENCRDWETGIPIDLDKIRDKDEAYWDNYRGSPKAFITLSAGRKIWANRYGNLTAVRYSINNGDSENIAQKVLSRVDPASLGLFFQPVLALGRKAGEGSTDFGQLFLGLSMFLIISAMILMGLLFVFGVESRGQQTGTLLAIGFSPGKVRLLLILEGGILALTGAIIGTVAALYYTQIMIYGLSTIWQNAIGGSTIQFHFEPVTLYTGAAAALIICLFTIWLTLRKQVSRPARELLAGGSEWQLPMNDKLTIKRRFGLITAITATIGAIVLIVIAGTGGSSMASGAFFGAGALLLIAGLGFTQAILVKLSNGSNHRRKVMSSINDLGLRNSTRRRSRSLAVVGLLACGIFLIIAVGANKHDPLANAQKRDSGTGGFALYGESAIGVLYDLNSESGQKSMSLDEPDLDGVEFVQLRVQEGDDASCLNLNRAQKPRLLGVQPYQLQMRGAFGFTSEIENADNKKGWDLLDLEPGDNIVPAIGDYATVYWALEKSVGDDIDYTDEKGRHFKLRIVGMIKNSILQGNLLISENAFIRRFPSVDGYRVLLVDSPQGTTNKVSDRLSFLLSDYGLTLTPTVRRLAAFGAVESTYLSIFQLLGGLGLVLGSVGLGLVVLRNVLERRGELAMLRAVGFSRDALKKMVFHEHTGLMIAGLTFGIIAALVAVSPALKSPGADVPYLSLTLTIFAIATSGLLWIWLATIFALSGKMLDALRNE
jgi:putative ABC transport system permease protein